ncbi:DUF1059 domain-containing protein [Neptuniibacter sp. QD29_5]|uniref:DUF1059 domain-containing protein n=1 Tax=unclassified Neptuniibacter TaxID=2630693 RepID=UPI0039F6F303
MTCRQLGGGCDLEFKANTFEEMSELAKQHGMEMFQQQDTDHLAAMQKVQLMMLDPEAMQAWMNEKREEFNALPND